MQSIPLPILADQINAFGIKQSYNSAFWDGWIPGVSALVNRFPTRTFFGAATPNDAIYSVGIDSPLGFTDKDWLGKLARSSINGGNGIGVPFGNDINYSQVAILADSDSVPGTRDVPLIGLTIGMQTINSLGGSSNRTLNLYAVNNSPRAESIPAHALYAEGHQVGASIGNTYVGELEGRNSKGLGDDWTPYSSSGPGMIALSISAGAGLSPVGQYPIKAGIYFRANPMAMATGIMFYGNSICSCGPNGSYPAIRLARKYAIQWWNSSGLASSIATDDFDNLVIGTGSGDFITSGNIATGDGSVIRFGPGGDSWISGSSIGGFVLIATGGIERMRIRANSAINFNPRLDSPFSPIEGDSYYDGLLHKMRTWDGTAWHDHW